MTALNPIAARVEAAIPGATELTQAEAALRDAKPTDSFPGEGAAVRRVVAQLASELFASGVYPTDAAERIAAARAEQRQKFAEREAHGLLVEAVKGMREAAREDATGARLDVLRAELAEIVEGARDADQRLGSAETVEQAVKAGADTTAAWVELDALAGRWAALTEVHRRVLRDESTTTVNVDQFARHGIVRNLRHGWPGEGTDRAHPRPDYPHHLTDPDRIVQTPEGLRWAIRMHDDESAPGVYLWVPSRDDLHEADRRDEIEHRDGLHPVLT